MKKVVVWMLKAILALSSGCLTAALLLALVFAGTVSRETYRDPARLDMMEKYDMFMNNAVSDALEGVLSIKKVYWLTDEDLVAPEPYPEKYGETTDPAEIAQLAEDAEALLEGQELLLLTTGTPAEGRQIHYYLDDTILAVTWQETVGKMVYTFSEVKIAHPSQFRRFFSDGSFGSGKLYKATEMAASVNAVVASNADYYAYRGFGNIVYNGSVLHAGDRFLDTCYVDENGDLLLVDYGQVVTQNAVEAYVKENNVRFSLAFGPIMIRDGEYVRKLFYSVGQGEEFYSRAALCQLGPLHYMVVTVNRRGQNVERFARYLLEKGVPKAYALDGGQTSTIVMGDKLMNPVDYGGERDTSDILYFATALPGGG